jgi:hypothetical protein
MIILTTYEIRFRDSQKKRERERGDLVRRVEYWWGGKVNLRQRPKCRVALAPTESVRSADWPRRRRGGKPRMWKERPAIEASPGCKLTSSFKFFCSLNFFCSFWMQTDFVSKELTSSWILILAKASEFLKERGASPGCKRQRSRQLPLPTRS